MNKWLMCLAPSARLREQCLALALGAALLLGAGSRAATFVELTADFEVTNWHHQEETGLPLKTSRTFSVRCVVGTNTWLIEQTSPTNAQQNVWFVDGKIIRLTAPSVDADPDDSEFRATRRGTRYLNIVATDDGYPTGDLSLNLPWFAFCSGPYLKRVKESVPLPAPQRGGPAFGLRPEMIVFADSLGLPRSVQFYGGQRQLKCDYQVQQSTNLLGWNFPTSFTVAQNEPDSFGVWKRQLAVSARVKSIRSAREPKLTEEVRQRVEMWERSPSRKK